MIFSKIHSTLDILSRYYEITTNSDRIVPARFHHNSISLYRSRKFSSVLKNILIDFDSIFISDHFKRTSKYVNSISVSDKIIMSKMVKRIYCVLRYRFSSYSMTDKFSIEKLIEINFEVDESTSLFTENCILSIQIF